MLKDWQAFQALAKAFAEGQACLRVAGLAGSGRPLAVAELLRAHPRPAVVVVRSMVDAHRWAQDLKFFGAPVLEFPEREPRLWRGGHHREADAERAVIARRLGAGEPVVVVATPAGLDTPLPPPADFTRPHAAHRHRRPPGARAAAGGLRDGRLRARGDGRRGGAVERAGRHRRRLLAEPPERRCALEFFGDEVESIRRFDPTTQRSTEMLDELLVLPLGAPADEAGAAYLLDYVPALAPMILDAPALLDETSEEAPGRRAARRGPGRATPRGAGAGRRHRRRARARHPGGAALHRPLRAAHRGARALASRGLHGAAGRGRRAPGRAPAADPARPRRSRCRSRGRSTRRSRRPSSSASARRASPSPRSASSCSPRPRSSALAAGALRRPKYQRGAAHRRPSPTWRSTTSWSTRTTASAVTSACARWPSAIARRDFLLLEYSEGGPALRAGRAARPGLQVPRRRRRDRPARPAGRRLLAAGEGVGAGGPARDGRGAAEALRAAGGGPGPRVHRRLAVAARVRGGLPIRGDAGPAPGHRGGQARHAGHPADGPAGRRRRRLRQDRGRPARRLQGGSRWPSGGRAGADHRAGPAALVDLHRPLRPVSGEGRAALALPVAQGAEGGGRGAAPGHVSTSSSAPTACSPRTSSSRTWGC